MTITPWSRNGYDNGETPPEALILHEARHQIAVMYRIEKLTKTKLLYRAQPALLSTGIKVVADPTYKKRRHLGDVFQEETGVQVPREPETVTRREFLGVAEALIYRCYDGEDAPYWTNRPVTSAEQGQYRAGDGTKPVPLLFCTPRGKVYIEIDNKSPRRIQAAKLYKLGYAAFVFDGYEDGLWQNWGTYTPYDSAVAIQDAAMHEIAAHVLGRTDAGTPTKPTATHQHHAGDAVKRRRRWTRPEAT